MRKSTWGVMLLLAVISVFVGAQAVQAQESATQTVSFEVQAINAIAVSGDPGPLTISAATPGSPPTPVTDNTTTYDITYNGTAGGTITAAIDTAMPAGLTLQVNLGAPTGATSAGDVTLSAIAADVVTGIPPVAESGLGITYTLSADASAGVVAPQTRTVTLTIVAGV